MNLYKFFTSALVVIMTIVSVSFPINVSAYTDNDPIPFTDRNLKALLNNLYFGKGTLTNPSYDDITYGAAKKVANWRFHQSSAFTRNQSDIVSTFPIKDLNGLEFFPSIASIEFNSQFLTGADTSVFDRFNQQITLFHHQNIVNPPVYRAFNDENLSQIVKHFKK